jgi:hypothetical protein
MSKSTKTVRREIKYSQNPPPPQKPFIGPLFSANSGTREKTPVSVNWAPPAILARSQSNTDWGPDKTMKEILESDTASKFLREIESKLRPEQLEMTITEFRESIKGKYGKNKMIPRGNTIKSVTIGGINYEYIIDDELWSTTQEKEKAIKDMANEAGWGKWSIDKVRDDDGNMYTKVCDLATSNCFLIAAGAVLAAAALQSGHIGGKKKTIKSKRKPHKKSKSHKKTINHNKRNMNHSRKRRHSYKKH